MEKEDSRVTLLVGTGDDVENRGLALKAGLKKRGFRVAIIPISDKGILELLSGRYIYRGEEVEEIEKDFSEGKNNMNRVSAAT